MASLQLIKNGVDLTPELVTNNYDRQICDGLTNLFKENKEIFDQFSGLFTLQLSFDKIFYSYLGTDGSPDALKGPRNLIDTFINQTNLDW